MRFVKTLKKREKKVTETKELQKILKEHGVKLAYLFGSHAKGQITKFSDVDIGVLFKKTKNKKPIDSLRVKITNLLKEEAIDIIDLERAPPKLKYEVIKHGKIIHGKNISKEFEIQAMKEYFDFKPMEDLYFKQMETRIKKGKYGH